MEESKSRGLQYQAEGINKHCTRYRMCRVTSWDGGCEWVPSSMTVDGEEGIPNKQRNLSMKLTSLDCPPALPWRSGSVGFAVRSGVLAGAGESAGGTGARRRRERKEGEGQEGGGRGEDGRRGASAAAAGEGADRNRTQASSPARIDGIQAGLEEDHPGPYSLHGPWIHLVTQRMERHGPRQENFNFYCAFIYLLYPFLQP